MPCGTTASQVVRDQVRYLTPFGMAGGTQRGGDWVVTEGMGGETRRTVQKCETYAPPI